MAQAVHQIHYLYFVTVFILPITMPMKAMKSMKAGNKAMSKGAMTKALATEHELKQKGVFTIPGLCRLKTRVKPATKAGVRMMFGQETKVKAKPAKTVVKAFPVSAFKKQI